MSDETSEPRTVVKKKEAQRKYLPLGDTQWREHERNDPDFPKAVPLTIKGRAVAYFLDEIVRYQKILERRRAQKLAQRSRKSVAS